MRFLMGEEIMKIMRMKNGLKLAVFLGALCCFAACKKAPEEKKEILTNPGWQADELIMKSGEHRMNLEDYKQCISLHRLQGHFFSKRALANPRFQLDEAQRCFALTLMRDYAKENHLKPTQDLKTLVLNEAYKTLDVESDAEIMRKVGISSEKFEALIEDAMLPRMIQRHLLETMPEAEAQALFNTDARRYSFQIIDFPNEPTKDEVEAYLKEHERDVLLYLKAHPKLMRRLPRAQFLRFSFPKTGDDSDVMAFKGAGELRQKAMKDPWNAESILTQECQKDKRCTVLDSQENPYIEDRNEENAWAFRAPVGTVSEVLNLPASNDVWFVKEIEPPEPYDFSDASVRKILTEKVMKETVAAPHFLAKLKPLLEAPIPDLQKIAEENGGRYRAYNDLTFAYITHHNLIESPEVLKVLSEMSVKESRLFSNPIVENSRIYVFYVSNLTPATDEDYKNNKAKWIEHLSNDSKADLTRAWIEKQTPSLTTMNLKPVEFEFGILQPNGTIR